MADIIYDSFKEFLGDGTIDMDGDAFKIALLGSGYVPDAAHSQFSDVSGAEISGAGYTAGGATLGNVVWSRTGGTVTFDADDPQWESATFTARYAVIYDDATVDKNLVKLFDFDSDKSVSGGTFTIQFNASGILTLS